MSADRDSVDDLFEKAGHHFDRQGAVVAGDDALMERIVRRVERRTGTRAGRSRRAAFALAACLLLAGVALAAVKLARPRPVPPALVPAAPAATAPMLEAARPAEPAAPPALESPLPPPQAATDAEQHLPDRQPRAPRALASASAGAAPTSALSAAELFATANRARVKGDSAAAIAAYQTLQANFPSSNEAITAHLSLGMLYLQQRKPAQALQSIRTYRSLRGGAGGAEALWGEAQALAQLGRSSEERAVLSELLQNYPQSAFAAAAQKRLTALAAP